MFNKKKDLDEWLLWLESNDQNLKKDPTFSSLSLDRIKIVADELSFIDFPCPVITVAGTNGKGTCVATMEAILLAANKNVGTYTSPHLLSFTERIKVNGNNIADEQCCKAFEHIKKTLDQLSVVVTYFEFIVLAALHIFKRQKLDIILLEVGLGGRLDATNIVNNDVGVITTIDLDHCEMLGETKEEIAYEKASIYRDQAAAVCGDFSPPDIINEMAKKKTSNFSRLGRDFNYHVEQSTWAWQSKNNCYTNLPIPKVPLQNAATAIAALEFLEDLQLTQKHIHSGLETVCLAGRYQKLNFINDNGISIELIFDVAHNPLAARWLASKLVSEPVDGKTFAIFGVLDSKDWQGIIEPFIRSDIIDEWYICNLKTSSSREAGWLAGEMEGRVSVPAKAYASVAVALQRAKALAKEGDRIVIYGSFYTVTEGLTAVYEDKIVIKKG